MIDQKPTLRARVAKLRSDPRVAAFSLIGPSGQVFALVDELVGELDSQDARIRALELQLKGLGALTVNHLGS